MVHCIYFWITGYTFQTNNVFLSLMIDFGFANRADPDEMPHNAPFNLDLDCLPKYQFRGSNTQRVNQLVGGETLRHVGVPEFLH